MSSERVATARMERDRLWEIARREAGASERERDCMMLAVEASIRFASLEAESAPDAEDKVALLEAKERDHEARLRQLEAEAIADGRVQPTDRERSKPIATCEKCDRPARYCGETHPYTPPPEPSIAEQLRALIPKLPHGLRLEQRGAWYTAAGFLAEIARAAEASEGEGSE